MPYRVIAVNGSSLRLSAGRRAALLSRGSLLALALASAHATTAQAQSRTGEPATITLETIDVQGRAETAVGPVDGYRASRSATATKTDTALRDTPQSIQVVPRDVLVDQQATSVAEGLTRNVPGVVPYRAASFGEDRFAIRGFEALTIYRNGVPFDMGVLTTRGSDPVNVERIEVLKGPASILYGRGEPGGVINVVTRRPSDVPAYEASVQAGSRGFGRTTFGATGPLNEDKTLLYRFDGALQRSDGFVDFVDNRKYYLAPSLQWKPTQDFSLTLELERGRGWGGTGGALPAVGTAVPGLFGFLPRNLNLGEPIDRTIADDTKIRARAEWSLTPDWTARTTFGLTDFQTISRIHGSGSFRSDNRTWDRTGVVFDDQYWDYYFDQNLTGKVIDPFGFRHTLLLGAELRRQRNLDVTQFRSTTPLDVYNPVYGRVINGPLFVNSRTQTTIDSLGLYAQDQIALTDKFTIVAGGRFDMADREVSSRSGVSALTVTGSDTAVKAFSPRVGALYRPIEQVGFFANYSQSFKPLAGADIRGRAFEPETGEQFEGGVKVDWLAGGALSSTLSAFDLRRQNVLTADPANPFVSIQTGEQRVRGLEFDVTGEIAPGWRVIAGYAYLDAKTTADADPALVGKPVYGIPQHQANLWTTYEFKSGFARGLQVGVGGQYVGKRSGDALDSFSLGEFVRVDASLSYEITKNLKLGVSVTNLLDKTYLNSTNGSRSFVYYGEPRTTLVSLSGKF